VDDLVESAEVERDAAWRDGGCHAEAMLESSAYGMQGEPLAVGDVDCSAHFSRRRWLDDRRWENVAGRIEARRIRTQLVSPGEHPLLADDRP
jgi:hypothetical protein